MSHTKKEAAILIYRRKEATTATHAAHHSVQRSPCRGTLAVSRAIHYAMQLRPPQRQASHHLHPDTRMPSQLETSSRRARGHGRRRGAGLIGLSQPACLVFLANINSELSDDAPEDLPPQHRE